MYINQQIILNAHYLVLIGHCPTKGQEFTIRAELPSIVLYHYYCTLLAGTKRKMHHEIYIFLFRHSLPFGLVLKSLNSIKMNLENEKFKYNVTNFPQCFSLIDIILSLKLL